jgi:hypothetical protein
MKKWLSFLPPYRHLIGYTIIGVIFQNALYFCGLDFKCVAIVFTIIMTEEAFTNKTSVCCIPYDHNL